MPIRWVFFLFIFVAVTGCVRIEGFANSSLVRPIPPAPTFKLESQTGNDPVIDRKVGQLIAYQLLRKGFQNPSKDQPPDTVVRFSFDVALAGTTSTAFTTINQPKQRATVIGNTVYTKQSTATATTHVSKNQNYRKTVAVQIVDGRSGETHWEGQVFEEGWCNQILVTTPEILTLMFERFPEDMTNVSKRVNDGDPGVLELRKLFPPDTNWSCK